MQTRKTFKVIIEKEYINSLESKRLASNLSRVDIINMEYNKLKQKLAQSRTYEFKCTPIDKIKIHYYHIILIDNSVKNIETLATKLGIPKIYLLRELLISFIKQEDTDLNNKK